MSINLKEFFDTNKISDYVREELTLCIDCAGVGKKSHRELVDYHKGDYDVTFTTCTSCNGSGRIYKQTISIIGIRPYV